LVGISGDVEQGRERLRSMASSLEDQAMRPRLITAESRMLQTAGQANEAVLVLTEGLAEIPDNEDLLYARALAANAADDINLMMADLNRLIEKDPDNAHALNALGYHLADSNVELDRAEELLVKANQLLPDDPAIMDSLGWLRYRQGRFDEAITLLKAAYAMFPDAEIAAHLGEALWLNGNEQEARKLIEEALVESPDDERLIQVMKQYGE
jgi:Flp pilus assembly protein TadD